MVPFREFRTHDCIIENPGRFDPVSFQPSRFSMGLLHTSQLWQHLSLLFDIGLQKVNMTECYTSAREFGSIQPIIEVCRFVLGRSFRHRDVSDSLSRWLFYKCVPA